MSPEKTRRRTRPGSGLCLRRMERFRSAGRKYTVTVLLPDGEKPLRDISIADVASGQKADSRGVLPQGSSSAPALNLAVLPRRVTAGLRMSSVASPTRLGTGFPGLFGGW